MQSNLLGSIDNYYCLPDDFKESLVGQFGNPYFKTGNLYVTFCNNSTTNNTCLPKNDIVTDLSMFYAQYIFLDYYSDLTDFYNPLKPYWRSDLLQVSSSSYRIDQYSFRISNLVTDDGYILQSENTFSNFQLDSKSTVVLGPNPDNLLTIRSDISNLNLISGRKYMKLQSVLANKGGLLNLLQLYLDFFVNI